MKDLIYISGEINKGKNLEVNMPKYANSMISLYNGLAYIKLSMNYYTFYEMTHDDDDESKREVDRILADIITELNDVIEAEITAQSGVETLEASVAKVDLLRNRMIKIMEVVTSYVDKLKIYEYLLNRVEFRFNEEELDETYYGTYLTNDIIQYIIQDSDNVVVNSKISEVVGQLPVRMSKGKFFEHLKDAFSLYYGAQKGTIDDFVYMLRTTAMLDTPDGFEEYFSEMNDVYEMLKNADYKNMEQDEWKKLSDAVYMSAGKMSDIADLCVMATQLINDVYTVLLSKMYAFSDVEEVEKAKYIIGQVCQSFKNSEFELDDEKIYEAFVSFEGKQERIAASVSANDFVVSYAIENLSDTLQSLMLEKIYASLEVILKLQSGSDFVELIADEEKLEEVENEYIDACCDKLIEEFEHYFKEQSQVVNRAVMAAILSILPVFFNNIDEIQSYINVSLLQCNDIAERKATVEIMKMIIFEN